MTRTDRRQKIAFAYAMNEMAYPMGREETVIRAVIRADLRRFRDTGSYRRAADPDFDFPRRNTAEECA